MEHSTKGKGQQYPKSGIHLAYLRHFLTCHFLNTSATTENATDSKGYILYEIKCCTVSFVISLAWIYGEPHWCKNKVKGRGERMEERRQEGCSVFLLHYWGWVLGSLRHVGILNHLHPANVSSHLALLPSASFLHFSMKSPPPHFYICPGLSSIIVGDKGLFPMLSWPEPDGYG